METDASATGVKKPKRPAYDQLLSDRKLIHSAVRKAVREAVLTHARAGNPVPTWREGKVVWIPPDEILAQLNQNEPTGS
jgi:hypothetical protein